MEKISIIVPCYNEEEAIPIFYEEIKKVFKTMNYRLELIFVDDGKRSILRVGKWESDRKFSIFTKSTQKQANFLIL